MKKVFTLSIALVFFATHVVGISFAQVAYSPKNETQTPLGLEALASTMAGDRDTLFEYVRDNMDYQPYYGCMKGPLGTYWEKSGNDIDQASLLVALLQMSDIEARYVSGVIGLPIGLVANWVGVKTSDAAVEVFASNKIPAEAILSSGVIVGLKFQHIWVEAYDDGTDTWVGLDPSFKQYAYHEGLGIPVTMDFDALHDAVMVGATVDGDFIDDLNMAGMDLIVDEYKDTLQAYAESLPDDTFVGNVVGYRTISSAGNGILPSEDCTFSELIPFQHIPEEFTYQIKYELDGLEHTISTTETAGKSISIEYVPTTQKDADLIAGAGNIYDVDLPYNVYMLPTLRIGGVEVARGTVSNRLGNPRTLYVSFLNPGETEWSTDERSVRVGAGYSLVHDGQRMSLGLYRARLATLEAAFAEYENGDHDPDGVVPVEIMEEFRDLLGVGLFLAIDSAGEVMAQDAGIVWTRGHSHLVVAQDLAVEGSWNFYTEIDPGPFTFDLQRDGIICTAVAGDIESEIAWTLTRGSMVSRQEASILQDVFGETAISTVVVLDAVSRDQKRIYTITPENVAQTACMLHSSTVREHIKDAVEKGWSAICPQHSTQIGNWSGFGWVEWDPKTGKSCFWILGEIDGDKFAQIVMGGGATDGHFFPGDDLVGKGLLALHELEALGLGLALIFGGLYGMKAAAEYGLAMGLLGGWAFGGLALLALLALGLGLYGHFVHMPVIPRREEQWG